MLVFLHANIIAPVAVTRHSSGAPQGELSYQSSTGYDILFECWAIADRLSMHAAAAQCEWVLAQLWERETAYKRAALELSPGALQRIARSLCVGRTAAYQAFRRVLHLAKYPGKKESAQLRVAAQLDEVSTYQVETESADTMRQWRQWEDK
jgi:hypothetical protein